MTFIDAVVFGGLLLLLAIPNKKLFIGIMIVETAKIIGALLLLSFMLLVTITGLNWLGLPSSPFELIPGFLAWIAVLKWIAHVLRNREISKKA